MRTSIVLGKNGGALHPIKRLTQLGLGGKQGNGTQKFSWIHEVDFAQSIAFILNNPKLDGVVNIVAPTPSTNNELMKLMRKNLGRNVIPSRLLKAGYTFGFSTLETSLKDLLK